MKHLKINRFVACLMVLAGFVTASFLLLPASTQAVASGCSSSRPTAITGSITAYGGDYHNWSVNVLIGMDLINAADKKVNPGGSTFSGGAYSYVDKVNPTMVPPGAASGFERTFGESIPDGNRVLCVSSAVKVVWFEVYPKTERGATQKTYYGGSNDQRMTVKVGQTNSYGVRIPTAHEYGGNTGDVNGYASYHGSPISPSNLSFTAFPTVRGSDCGVQGFSAGAENVGVSSSQHATYYLIKNLAGGQCGGATQTYKVTASCKNNACGGNKSKTTSIKVGNGSRPRLDFKF